MNTIQIKKILSNDEKTKRNFIGVFSRDEIPLNLKFPCCFVINTDSSNKPGEHWLAFYFKKNSECEFFDSIRYPPSFYKLEKYLYRVSKNFSYSKYAIQSIYSKYWKLYCVLFLLLRNREISINSFFKFFDADCIKNDEYLTKMLKNNFFI